MKYLEKHEEKYIHIPKKLFGTIIGFLVSAYFSWGFLVSLHYPLHIPDIFKPSAFVIVLMLMICPFYISIKIYKED